MKKAFLIALLLSFGWLSPAPAQAACTSSKAAGAIRVGSQISGGSVFICAAAGSIASNVKNKVVAKKVVIPIKPVAVPCVIKIKTPLAPGASRIAGCTYLSVAAPKPVVITKSKPVISTSSSLQNDQAAFTPNPVGIAANPNSGVVGQAFFFGAIAAAHSRAGTVLGRSATVNFTPLSFEWNSDEGDVGNGGAFSAAFSSPGVHSIGLTVTYSVSYSVGAGWLDAGVISASASTAVQVGQPVSEVFAAQSPPLLVSGNCNQRPSSYRC